MNMFHALFMPDALIADRMIARQLKITEKALNRGQITLNDHESTVQSTVQSPGIVETPKRHRCLNSKLVSYQNKALK